MNKIFISIVVLATLASCGSSKKKERELEEREHTQIQRPYIVRDALSTIRPGWIEDAEVWARSHENFDLNKFRYFSYETEPKATREVACKMAEQEFRTGIAAEISTFIDKSLTTTLEGDASIDMNNPEVKALEQYVDEVLVSKVSGTVNGAAVLKSYWEYRQYLQKQGAKKDFNAYTCAVFGRISVQNLEDAIKRSVDLVKGQAKGDLKAKVEAALKNAESNFIKEHTSQE
jgi:hypothetical protein